MKKVKKTMTCVAAMSVLATGVPMEVLSVQAATVERHAESKVKNQITVVYEDENGKELSPSEELKGKGGETYASKAREIEGYKLKEMPMNAAGVFTSEAQTVRYMYVKEESVKGVPVIVVYEDENGKELAPSEELIGKEGEAYESKAKEVKDYTLKETPTNASGVSTNEVQTVRYVYKKKEELLIPDPNLRSNIARELGISEQEITQSSMQRLTYLYVDEKVQSLEGLQYATNLTRLEIHNDKIRDINPLSELTNLEDLEIYDLEIRDISPLSGLTKLYSLVLSGNEIQDISPLSGLTKLKYLHLDSNRISDVSPLSGLSNLFTLDISGNKIQDISPLSGLTNLWDLYIYENKIRDISPLSGLTKLDQLDLADNEISDASPLSGLTNLEFLHLDSNQISDVSPLSGLTKLITLNLSENEISDASPLSKLSISNVDFSKQEIVIQESISPTKIKIRDMQGKVPDLKTITGGGGVYNEKTDLLSWEQVGENSLSFISGEFSGTITQNVEVVAVEGAPVKVIYEDESGNELAPSEELKGKEGNAYESKAKEIKGYSLRETPTNANGVFTSEAQTVRYVYKKEEEVSIPDPNLRKGIAKELGISEELITKTAMQGLDSLYIEGANIQSLEGLQYATNLKSLGFTGNKIKDIGPLSKLTRLEFLDLDSNEIKDISPLSGLTYLFVLNLSKNKIRDISPLSGLTEGLFELNLSENEISDASPLMELMIDLDKLDISEQEIVIKESSSPTKIKIRGKGGDVPSLKAITGGGFNYNEKTDRLIWKQVGENSLSFTSGKLSGTITQSVETVEEELEGAPVTVVYEDEDGKEVAPSEKLTGKEGETYKSKAKEIKDYTLKETPTNANGEFTSEAQTVRYVYMKEEEVTIPDPVLRSKIASRLGVTPEKITKNAMQRLTSLDIQHDRVLLLEGLQYATSLTSLKLNSNEISDISPLSGLTNLEDLFLSYNEIRDISPLSGLTNLKYLKLDSNEIRDVSPLSGLTNLEYLRLNSNEIRDISPLSRLTRLYHLALDSNEISDVSPLPGLQNLRSLQLSKNKISDASPLSKLGIGNMNLSEQEVVIQESSSSPKIKIRDIQGNVPTLNPIAGGGFEYDEKKNLLSWKQVGQNSLSFTSGKFSGTITQNVGAVEGAQVTVVYEDENGKELAPSEELKGKEGEAYESKAKKIKGYALKEMPSNANGVFTSEAQTVRYSYEKGEEVSIPDPNLRKRIAKELRIPEEQITKTAMQKLTSLKLDYRNIQSLEGLQFATKLNSLSLRENEISDVSPLSGLTNLKYLYLDDNEISDVSPLSVLTNLKELILPENKISDVSPLSRLTQLDYLNLSENKISDVSPLSGLTNLKYFYLVGNEISDISPLSGLTNLSSFDFSEQVIVIQESSSPTKIKIRDMQGKVPGLKYVTGEGFEYNEKTNLLSWKQVGENSLSFTSRDFSGTIMQRVEEISQAPEIHAEDQTIKIGDVFDPKAGVTAIDKEDGDLTDKIEVTENDVDTEKAGTYHVTYVVTDSDGNQTEKTIIVTVRTNDKPEIQAGDRTIKVGVEFDPKAGVTATDREDGDLTDKIEVTENDVDTEKVGTYHVTYVVTDSDGNKTEKTITVIVEEMGDYSISVNDFNIDSGTYISGTVGKNVQTVTIEVNGRVVNTIKPNVGAFTAYLRGYIQSVKDEVIVISKDKDGNTKEKVAVALLENHAALTVDDYNLERAYITGTVDPEATKVVLYVDGVAVRNSQLDSKNHTYKVYANEVTNTAQKVEVVASKGKSELKRVKVNVQEAPEYTLTADDYKLGSTFITGTVDPQVTKAVLYIDGVAVRNSQLDPETHTYKVYAHDVTSATQKVEVVASKKTSEVKRITVNIK
ncbi:hypothetical protein CON22_20790 [Bacillus cereus]|nr:hypothetical protein CON22_20790 [Bacillus cereus]